MYPVEVDYRGSAPRSLVSLLQNRIKLLEEVIRLHSIDLEASLAHIGTTKSGAQQTDSEHSPVVSTSTLDLDLAPDQSGAKGSFASEEPPGYSGIRAGVEVQFFGPTSGRLEFDSPEPEHVVSQNESTAGEEPRSLRHASREHFNAYCQSLTSQALQSLAPEIVEQLIDLYFEWEQPWFQVVDEGLFRDSRQHDGRYFSPLLLCCIIAIASRYSDSPELRSDPNDANSAGIMFLEHAEVLLHFELKWPSITTIQSLAIMAILHVVSRHQASTSTTQSTGSDFTDHRPWGPMPQGGYTMVWRLD